LVLCASLQCRSALLTITIHHYLPEFADLVVMPCTHGKNCEEAIHKGEEVIEMYLEAWQAEGEPIPEPRTLQVV
jgi:predicted RNase H-like HicB family nuclease